MTAPRTVPGLFQRLLSLVEAVLRTPLSPLGNGLTNGEAEPAKFKETGIIQDLLSQGKRIPEDLDLLLGILQTMRARGLVDDREYIVRTFSSSVLSGKKVNECIRRWRNSFN
jgi:hypothetical protein